MIKIIAHRLLDFEFLLFIPIIIVFWYPDQRRIFALLLFLPLLGARYILYRRLWKPTPLDPLLVAFLVLCALNAFIAPFFFIAPDIGGLVMLGRPLMGMLLATSLVDRAWRTGSMKSVLTPTILLALIVGILALVSSQWTVKSDQLGFFLRLLPQVRNIPQIGFNVNEIAGAMAYLTPLMAGLAVYFWSAPMDSRRNRLFGFSSSLAFCLLWAATFLGQSRFAIIGILPALALICFTLIKRKRWRNVALSLVAFFAVAELIIVSGIFSPQVDTLLERDEDSLTLRLLIWESGIHMVRDYPLTGVGMNAYRAPVVRSLYPVPSFEARILPHAHNEWIQVAADLGVPGLLIFASWFVALAGMLWKTWQQGDAQARAIALATGCGIAAHLFYGLGDAIPLWDRFAFVFWWMVGIGTAQYILVCVPAQSIENPLIRVKTT